MYGSVIEYDFWTRLNFKLFIFTLFLGVWGYSFKTIKFSIRTDGIYICVTSTLI